MIAIAVIVSVFGIGLLCMCCLLQASTSGGTSVADRHEPDDEAASSNSCGCFASIRRCCCWCKSDRASRSADRRQFSSLHALLYEIDEDETARIVLAAPGRHDIQEHHDANDDDHRQAPTTTSNVIDISMDLLFPDILSFPKDSDARQPQNTSTGSGTGLDEPLL